MGHQHMWDQRSSKGHLGVLTRGIDLVAEAFEKWSVMYFHGDLDIMIPG